MPFWVVLWPSVYYHTPQGFTGQAVKVHVRPGNFLPWKPHFLSLLFLKGQVETLLEMPT